MTARYWTGARRQLVPKAQGTRAYIYNHVETHEGMYLKVPANQYAGYLYVGGLQFYVGTKVAVPSSL